MEIIGIAWVESGLGLFSWLASLIWQALADCWELLVRLHGRYPEVLSPQNLFGLLGFVFAIWKWWEAREARLFRRFERMIERQEAELIKARSNILDIMNRPGPGLLISVPLFAEPPLRSILARRRWSRVFSILPDVQPIDRSLEKAITTCQIKMAAHLTRLAFFRKQVASALLIQGALAAARAARASEEHQSQRLDQEALDHFRAVLALPGHKEDLDALELVAHQLRRQDLQGDLQSQGAVDAYNSLITALEGMPESPNRNLLLARAKRWLAIVRYPKAPGTAQSLLDQAIGLLTDFGPRQDRDLLELAETLHLDGIARLRLRNTTLGPQQLSVAQGHYRDLLRRLRARRTALFRWMRSENRFSGHRVRELQARAEEGLRQVEHLIRLNNKRQRLLIASLARGDGVPRQSRKPPRLRRGRWLGF
jgi:hypothetical protein